MAKIIDGKRIASEMREDLKRRVQELKARGIVPGLAVVLVGQNPASEVYVRMKRKTCEEMGVCSISHDLPQDTPEQALLDLIAQLNADERVHGILVQLPMPRQIDEQKVLNAINPLKDVDGFHPVNVGKMLNGEPCFLPCTPAGCQELLMRSGYDPAGKHVVIVGRSNIVGKPLAAILIQKAKGANATVTVCHSRTQNLPEITRLGDILIAAIGVPQFIRGDMVREGAVVIDVGVNRIPDATTKTGQRLVGDVNFEEVSQIAEAITPVPGGVGPMTITMLMKNTIDAAERRL